jgi:hypothetical protein
MVHDEVKRIGVTKPNHHLFVVKQEGESNPKAGSRWAEPIPQHRDHAVGSRIGIWADVNIMASLMMDRSKNLLFSGTEMGHRSGTSCKLN